MKEYDQVEVIVEKEEYAKEGVHKGMIGQILDPRCIEESWLVYFEDPITFGDEIGIPIKEKDLNLVWEAPFIEVGCKVKLELSEYYYIHNLKDGLCGRVIDKDTEKNCWIVEFKMSNGEVKRISATNEELCYIREEWNI